VEIDAAHVDAALTTTRTVRRRLDRAHPAAHPGDARHMRATVEGIAALTEAATTQRQPGPGEQPAPGMTAPHSSAKT
jgi:hypothetical protein